MFEIKIEMKLKIHKITEQQLTNLSNGVRLKLSNNIRQEAVNIKLKLAVS